MKNKIRLLKIIIKNFNKINYLKKLKILNDNKTIDLIIKTKKSVSRFGDGELNFVFRDDSSIGFQDNSDDLKKRLMQIITTQQNKVMIGLPNKFKSLCNDTFESKNFWINYGVANYYNFIKYIDFNKTYINTNFTRFYMDYLIKMHIPKKINKIKKIWDKRNIVIIEGENTKLGVGNDFFNNALSIKRIICPAKNAFASYNKILNISKKIDKSKLILIALGPTATVLAYDLGMLGYQALDVGHIDIEYEWFLRRATSKIPIEGKFVNEAKNNVIKSIEDKNYYSTIIAKVDIKELKK